MNADLKKAKSKSEKDLLTLIKLVGGHYYSPCGFSKNVSSRERVNAWETVFIHFLGFLTFPCYKKSNDVSI